MSSDEMERHRFASGDLTLSYLDAGGDGPVVVALHAHWMEASTYAPLAAALAPRWRVVAPDQRGHGHSDHATSYDREDYLSDLDALFAHLGIDHPVVMLGNSLGAANAYQFAARRPDLVRGLVVEDMGTVVDVDLGFIRPWAGLYPTRSALEERVGARMAPYLTASVRETAGGWRLAFDPEDVILSQDRLNGDHTADWLASSCPALIVRGHDSQVTARAALARMAEVRPDTRLVELRGGHVVHADDPDGFADAVGDFIGAL